MGMFDELKIDVPDGFVPKRTWQTKDFDCGLDVYEVRDGQLWRTEWGTHDAQPSMHTGVVRFYAYGDSGEWIEWCAEFHDGKLVEVRKTEEPIRGPGEALRGPEPEHTERDCPGRARYFERRRKKETPTP